MILAQIGHLLQDEEIFFSNEFPSLKLTIFLTLVKTKAVFNFFSKENSGAEVLM